MSTLGLPPDISKIAGSRLIAYLLQWGLFGVLSVQVYIYYLAFSKDPPTRKILVYAVYVVEFVQTILLSQMALKELAAGFGSFVALREVSNSWFTVPILSLTVGFTVHIFYAHKIKSLANSKFIAAVVVLLALIPLGGGIGAGVLSRQPLLVSEAVATPNTVGILYFIWLAGSAVCDIIIAVSMTYYVCFAFMAVLSFFLGFDSLGKQLSQSKTTWKSTQRIVQRLIFLFIGSGAFTATIAIITFVLFKLPGRSEYHVITIGILGKMYSNTMMVIMNNRIVLQAQDESIMFAEHVPSSTSCPIRTSLKDLHLALRIAVPW